MDGVAVGDVVMGTDVDELIVVEVPVGEFVVVALPDFEARSAEGLDVERALELLDCVEEEG